MKIENITEGHPAFRAVDIITADLDVDGSIYEGFAAAIMVRGQPRTVALCREFADALQLAAAISRARAVIEGRERIKATEAESGGWWRPCSGCYDTEDGHPTARYPHSPLLGMDVGSGCEECGGLGARFETYTVENQAADVAELARDPANDLDLYDPAVQQGIAWTLRQLGEKLGADTWPEGDGSEGVEGDVGAEIANIMRAAGLVDTDGEPLNSSTYSHPRLPKDERLEIAREALEFYASSWDWYPGDGEAPDATHPGSAPTFYEAEANDDLKHEGGAIALKALSSMQQGGEK